MPEKVALGAERPIKAEPFQGGSGLPQFFEQKGQLCLQFRLYYSSLRGKLLVPEMTFKLSHFCQFVSIAKLALQRCF